MAENKKFGAVALIVMAFALLLGGNACPPPKFTRCDEASSQEQCVVEHFEQGYFRCRWDQSADEGKGACVEISLPPGGYGYEGTPEEEK